MNTYKATLRIPTEESYAYIEIAVENTPEAIVSAHREFSALVRPVDGLSQKEWNDVLTSYGLGKGMSPDTMLKLGKAQQWFIKEFDKMTARIEAKQVRANGQLENPQDH